MRGPAATQVQYIAGVFYENINSIYRFLAFFFIT